MKRKRADNGGVSYDGSVVEKEARHALGTLIRGKHELSVHEEKLSCEKKSYRLCVLCRILKTRAANQSVQLVDNAHWASFCNCAGKADWLHLLMPSHAVAFLVCCEQTDAEKKAIHPCHRNEAMPRALAHYEYQVKWKLRHGGQQCFISVVNLCVDVNTRRHGVSVHEENDEKNGEKKACLVCRAFRNVSPHV